MKDPAPAVATGHPDPSAPAPHGRRESLRCGLFELFAAHDARQPFVDAALELVQRWSGCAAAGLRLRDPHGEVPYAVMRGYDPVAWASENRLRLGRDECLCTRVIEGTLTGADAALARPGGGTHARDLGAFLTALPPDERACFRGRCHRAGFATVAVLPIRFGDRTVGALHLADPRPGVLDDAALADLEAAGALLGEALRRFDHAEALERSYRAERGLGALRSAALSAADEAALVDAALRTLEADGPLPLLGASVRLFAEGRAPAVRSARCGRCVDGRCERETEVEAGALEAPRFEPCGPDERAGASYAVPIRTPQGAALGVLRACTAQDRHDVGAERFLSAAASILASAVEARRTQAALHEADARFRSFFLDTGAGALILAPGPDARMLEWNRAVERILGGREHLANRPLAALQPAGAPDRIGPALEALRRGEHDHAACETRLVRPDGSVAEVRVYASAVRAQDGRLLHAVALVEDVTERVRAVEALRTSEERLARALDGDDAGVFDLSLEGDVLHLSGAFGRMLQRPEPRRREELLALVHAEDQPRLASLFRAHLAGHLPYLDAEARFETAAGGWKRVQIRGRLVAPAPGATPRVAGTFRDVTEARRLAEHLAVSERLASVGTLAAGVAHEMNNPLSYVLSNVGYALEELAAALPQGSQDRVALPAQQLSEVTEALREASHGAERVRRIVGGLHSLARASDDRTSLDLRDVLRLALDHVAGVARSRCALAAELAETPRVYASPHRLLQMLLNLLTNAVQAIPPGAPEQHTVHVRTALEGTMIRVEIRDTGVGMSEEVRGRIFEPFYTTRPVGEGTGLGLSVTHAIVRELGGRIEVESAPGQGSTFTILLPPVGGSLRAAT